LIVWSVKVVSNFWNNYTFSLFLSSSITEVSNLFNFLIKNKTQNMRYRLGTWNNQRSTCIILIFCCCLIIGILITFYCANIFIIFTFDCFVYRWNLPPSTESKWISWWAEFYTWWAIIIYQDQRNGEWNFIP